MSALPITDPSIKIIPSPEIVKLITSLNEVTMPENILNIYKASNKTSNKTPKKLEADAVDIKFTKEEENLIKSLPNDDTDIDEKLQNDNEEKKEEEKDNKITKTEFELHLNDMKWLSNTLAKMRAKGVTDLYLHELITDCDIVLPENAVLERNPELEARCQRLRKEQADREYRAMTKNVDNVRKHLPEDTIAFQMKQINRQLIAVLQFIFSVAAGFAFGFIGIELIVGNLDFGFRLLLGIMISLIIALAEIYFLAKKLNEEYEVSEIVQPTPSPKKSEKLHKD